MPWQPIETAPKDGTTIFLWGRCYRDGRGYAPDANVGWWEAEALEEPDWTTRQFDVEIKPTHWMPITPPSNE